MTMLDARFALIEQQLGDDLEKRIVCVLENAKARWPQWLKRIRKTDKWSREDMRGIDLVATTDRGPVLVQIKSSQGQARKFRFFHRKDHIPIMVIIADVRYPDEQIYQIVMHEIQTRYNEL